MNPNPGGGLAGAAPHCLYAATAIGAPETPALASPLRVETLIIGGGYTGLSTALHLAERGRDVALLEAHEPGFGGAGRNGGQVNAGLKYDPDVAERLLGPVYGARFTQRALRAPDALFALIERLGIPCEAQRRGTLRAAYSAPHASALRGVAEQWQRRRVPVELWTAEQMHAATGTRRYLAGIYDAQGGSLNPLSLARGLARAAQRAGAQIHGGSRVRAIAREGGGWRASTDRAHVIADRVLIATDGYTDDLWPGLKRSVVPIYSAIIATEPLPAAWEHQILPGRQVVYESSHITVYYRRDASGRLLMGGRGVQRTANERADYEHLVRYARRLWPQLEHVEWTHWWNGQFALSADFVPRFHAPAPGLYIFLAYSGRGLALGSTIGAELAEVLAGGSLESFLLPVSPVRPMVGHRFWRLGVQTKVWQGRLLDRLGR
jgi:glycine/D-amino acid oxidase-like deaminating enzyme